MPIFEPVMQAVWAHIAPRSALAPPSPEAKRQLACKSVGREGREAQRGGAVTECFRVDRKGNIIDTQYRLVSRSSAYARADREERPARVSRHREQRYSVRAWQPWGWGWAAPRTYPNYYYRW